VLAVSPTENIMFGIFRVFCLFVMPTINPEIITAYRRHNEIIIAHSVFIVGIPNKRKTLKMPNIISVWDTLCLTFPALLYS